MINCSSHPYLENIQKENDNCTKWSGNISLIIKYRNVFFPLGFHTLLSSPLFGLGVTIWLGMLSLGVAEW